MIWIHYSWLFVLIYVTWITRTLASDRFPELSSGEHWLTGVVIALILFASALYREMARSLVTQRFGNKIPSLTFSIFGGSRDESEEVYRRPAEEAGVAASGLLATLSVSIVFFVLLGRVTGGDPDSSSLAVAIIFYAAWINLWFTVFNAIPGLPLDGGKLLHSLVWKITDDFDLGMRWAAGSGVGLFGLLALFGLLRTISGDAAAGVWILLVGGMLTASAWAILKPEAPETAVRWNRYGPQGGGGRSGSPPGRTSPELPAGQAMLSNHSGWNSLATGTFVPLATAIHPTPVQVSAAEPLAGVMSKLKGSAGQQQIVPVFRPDGPAGFFVVSDAEKYPANYWETMAVSAVLRSQLVHTASVHEDARSVLGRLQDLQYPFALVSDGADVVGVVSQSALQSTIAAYAQG